MKNDLADGFYQLFFQLEDVLALAMVLPVAALEEPLVAIPLTLSMRWMESPSYFCFDNRNGHRPSQLIC